MEADWLLTVTGYRYGERWREGRKIADRHRGLRPAAVSLFHQRIEETTRRFLSQLLASPTNFRDHIEWSVVPLLCSSCFLEAAVPHKFQGKVIMSLVYSYGLKENDKIVVAPVELGHILGRLVLPGAALVNHFPFRMNLHFAIASRKRIWQPFSVRHIPSWVPWLSYRWLD